MFHPGVYTFKSTFHQCYTSLSGSQQQTGSRSIRAQSWCWTLSGRNHFPTNSLTWKELLTGLTTCLFQPQSSPLPGERSYTGSITTCTEQQITCTPSLHDHYSQSGIQTQTSQTSSTMAARSHDVDFWNCMISNFRRELHRLSGSERGVRPAL